MRREYHRWFSTNLGRDMELLVFGHAGARVLVFPTRAGRFFDYENWGLVAAAAEKIARGHVQLFCVDSVDSESFYCDWKSPRCRVARHLQYEAYLLNEVLPLTRAVNPDPTLIAHGCSMGAYHAVNLAFRHPDRVGGVVAFSGRYDLTTPVADFRDLLDGHYDETVYFHTPSHFVPNLPDGDLLDRLRRMRITLVVGDADPFVGNNRHLGWALRGRGVSHELHVWDGRAHRPRYWRPMVAEYL
ncbi:MAG: esterase family protein [Fimbriiglobus sp.]